MVRGKRDSEVPACCAFTDHKTVCNRGGTAEIGGYKLCTLHVGTLAVRRKLRVTEINPVTTKLGVRTLTVLDSLPGLHVLEEETRHGRMYERAKAQGMTLEQYLHRRDTRKELGTKVHDQKHFNALRRVAEARRKGIDLAYGDYIVYPKNER